MADRPDPVAPAPDDRAPAALVRASPLPLVLLRLPDGRTLEVSDSFAAFLRKTREECLTMDAASYGDDPQGARVSLSLLAAGTLDSYTRSVHLLRNDAEPVASSVHVSAWVERPPRHLALGTILPDIAPPVGPDVPGEPLSPATVVIGTLDQNWRIDRITSDGVEIFPFPADRLLGQSAFAGVHPGDVGILLMLAAHSAARAGRATGRVRVRGRGGGWLIARLTLQPLAGAGTAAFAFSLGVDSAEPDPVRRPELPDLDTLLDRNEREIRAAGLAAWMAALPTALDLPELTSLTTREHEIVLRLVTGQRVATIARALFLSESTVRNHLTAIFRRFGVHSQAELLERLRR